MNARRDEKGTITPNAQSLYEITRADLPLHCPMPGMSAWNSHPRVFLAIEEQGGKAMCPYCGARYVLKERGDEPVRFDPYSNR